MNTLTLDNIAVNTARDTGATIVDNGYGHEVYEVIDPTGRVKVRFGTGRNMNPTLDDGTPDLAVVVSEWDVDTWIVTTSYHFDAAAASGMYDAIKTWSA